MRILRFPKYTWDACKMGDVWISWTGKAWRLDGYDIDSANWTKLDEFELWAEEVMNDRRGEESSVADTTG